MKTRIPFALTAALLSSVAPVWAAPAALTLPQTPASAAATPTKPNLADPLGIPSFAGVPNEFVFAGTNEDLLGALQQFAQGASDAPKAEGEGAKGSIFGLDLNEVLGNIHVLRARSLSFRGISDEEADKILGAAPAQPLITPGQTQTMEEFNAKLNAPNQAAATEEDRLRSAEKFYQQLFDKQGGQTQLMLKSGEGATSIAIYGFSQPRSFALLVRGSSRVVVVRADGLPNLKALGRIFGQSVISN